MRVDVIDVIDAPDATGIPDPTDRLYEMSHAWALRTTAKEGTDLLDIVTILLDQAARDVALTQLERCDPVIATDAALHADRWFVKQVDRSLRLIRSAGGGDIGRDEIALVAELLAAATRR